MSEKPWSLYRSPEERVLELRSAIARLEEDDRKASENIDRAVIVGGTAAVIASATFVGSIVSHPASGSLALLRSSWIAFLFGAGLAFLSFFSTRAAARAYRRILEKQLAKGGELEPEDYDPVRWPNSLTRWLTRIGVVGFLTGAMLLALFAGRNLPREQASIPSDNKGAAFVEFLDSLRTSCRQHECVLVFGYDYDLPQKTVQHPDTSKRQPSSSQRR